VLAGTALSVFGAYAGSYSRILDLFGQFAIQAGLGALGLTIFFGALRRPVLASISAAIAVASYFAISIPSPVQPCVGVPTHRLLFFNIWDENTHTTPTVDFIAHQNADTIVLAEVNPRFRPALGELRKLYPYSIECPEGDHRCQFYIYSRFPIELATDGPRSWPLIEVTAAYPEGTVSLAGIHALRPVPIHRRWYQRWQVGHLADQISQTLQPRIIVGDFNAVSWGAIVKMVSRMASVKPLPSRGTWFALAPWPLRIPIDQALIDNGVACAKKTVGPAAFSDHRPIWIDFALKPAAAAKPSP
jgi:endonuclease/exonuclease/phosphatase (EEP) superfamily protein YafD